MASTPRVSPPSVAVVACLLSPPPSDSARHRHSTRLPGLASPPQPPPDSITYSPGPVSNSVLSPPFRAVSVPMLVAGRPIPSPRVRPASLHTGLREFTLTPRSFFIGIGMSSTFLFRGRVRRFTRRAGLARLDRLEPLPPVCESSSASPACMCCPGISMYVYMYIYLSVLLSAYVCICLCCVLLPGLASSSEAATHFPGDSVPMWWRVLAVTSYSWSVCLSSIGVCEVYRVRDHGRCC